jgi:hypothetical protein
VLVIPPFFENFGKRLVKSPRLYWTDSGLLCFLLGIESDAELARSPFAGSIFEGFVASEIAKSRQNHGLPRDLYFFRDEQGLEVDFVTLGAGGRVHLIEAKWAKTVFPADARSLQRLAAAVKKRPVDATIVCRGAAGGAAFGVVPGVRALAVDEFFDRTRTPVR